MHVLILGCGYLGTLLARRLHAQGAAVYATTRRAEAARALQAMGVNAVPASDPLEIPSDWRRRITHLVDSIPTEGAHAPQRAWAAALAERLPKLAWVGYLSSTSVYGDRQGAWVSEDDPLKPQGPTAQARVQAEQAWKAAFPAVEIFRLAGIYGPGRHLGPRLMQGYTTVAFAPPRYTNRIHAEDAARAIVAAMRRPRPARIVNLADDEPLPHAEYVRRLAAAIGAPPPVMLAPEEAKRRLSARAWAFFSASKRLSNARLHAELVPVLCYPNAEAAAAFVRREMLAHGARAVYARAAREG